MLRFINAKSEQGQWFSFEVQNGKFAKVRPEASKVTLQDALQAFPAEDALSLEEVLMGWSKPDWQSGRKLIDCKGHLIVPAAIDAHVHSRSPGLTHKEDWNTLAKGAYKGGVVAVCDMPNTIPPTMDRSSVLEKAALAKASGIEFGIFVGVGEHNIKTVRSLLTDPALPVVGLKVFYGRTTGELMYDDLETLSRSLPETGEKILVFHSEDQCTVDCNHAKLKPRLEGKNPSDFLVHSELRSSEAAHISTRTILDWALSSYKRPIHIAHISTPLEVELVAEAKAKGLPVTCEVAPHHLLFSTDDYAKLGPLVKMNPPLRSPKEVEELNRLVGKGAVDIFATDHAPHLLSEKYQDVARSPSGVPSVELFYPLVFEIVKKTGLAPKVAIEMSSALPAKLFGFKGKGQIKDGFDADFVWLGAPFTVERSEIVSKCGWSPFEGMTLPNKVMLTTHLGLPVYQAEL